MKSITYLALASLLLSACRRDDPNNGLTFYTVAIRSGTEFLNLQQPDQIPPLDPERPFRLQFNDPVDLQTANAGISLIDAGGTAQPLSISLESENTLVVAPTPALEHLQSYRLKVGNALKNTSGLACTPFELAFSTKAGLLKVDSIIAGGLSLLNAPLNQAVDRSFDARVYFNQPLDPATANAANVKVFRTNDFANLELSLENQNRILRVRAAQPLRDFDTYKLYLSTNLNGAAGYRLGADFTQSFFTAADPTPKFPLLSDEALLDLVQQQTFKYFWDFGHPVSGMARERNSSGDLVTTGGTGFGLMATIAAVERGFITRQQAVERWQKITQFLGNSAQRYHGAWAHWLNGATGQTIPFSTKDNGADLVETSFLIQGLLAVRQYLNPADPTEAALIQSIQTLWEGVEWDWFTRGGQNVLYWHWSPNYNWDMNLPIRGYNECLITYFLAAASPTHPIPAAVYHQGFAQNGQMQNNQSYYGITLPLGHPFGGPLFFAHYSFLGLDPRNLRDQYAEYWTQNVNHTLINRAYCIANPLNKAGYSAQCWGLTASDNHLGYNAHSPTNDLGVITPTAALSSFPYTPAASMDALKFFYYQLGDRLWGAYGFYDAFTPSAGWYANSFLAIDQGPIVVMIENHRSGKIWDLFMSAPEVAVAANKLGFTY